MVPYHFKVYIPSLNRKVLFHDITIRDWININKSIINNDYEEIINCFDLIIQECCIEKNLIFTILDKLIILLSIRSYSISTFCTLKITDKIEDKEFDYTLELNSLIDTLNNIPLIHKNTVDVNDLVIEYGIPIYPINDSNIILPSEYIHCIRYNGEIIISRDVNNLDDINQIMNFVDVKVYQDINVYAKQLVDAINTHPIYIIKSPWDTSRLLISQNMSINYDMYDLLKMLFTENLHNLYRSIYSFNRQLNISPEYTEQLIPVEKDLLWGYYIKDCNDEAERKKATTKTGTFTP